MSQANYKDDAHNPDSYHTTCPNCGERDTIFAKESSGRSRTTRPVGERPTMTDDNTNGVDEHKRVLNNLKRDIDLANWVRDFYSTARAHLQEALSKGEQRHQPYYLVCDLVDELEELLQGELSDDD
jgi:hypothetical protein